MAKAAAHPAAIHANVNDVWPGARGAISQHADLGFIAQFRATCIYRLSAGGDTTGVRLDLGFVALDVLRSSYPRPDLGFVSPRWCGAKPEHSSVAGGIAFDVRPGILARAVYQTKTARPEVRCTGKTGSIVEVIQPGYGTRMALKNW